MICKILSLGLGVCSALVLAGCGGDQPSNGDAVSYGANSEVSAPICLNYTIENPDAQVLYVNPVGHSGEPRWKVGISVSYGSMGTTHVADVTCSTIGDSAGVSFSCVPC